MLFLTVLKDAFKMDSSADKHSSSVAKLTALLAWFGLAYVQGIPKSKYGECWLCHNFLKVKGRVQTPIAIQEVR